MHDNSSSGIFCGARWTNSVNLLKKFGAEIHFIKMISFWQDFNNRKPSDDQKL
jgi:hypothetical protein